ncbi:MAG: methionyl-tRNA formyltransferase [Armatimonadetes bacterium]|nr:methionyl-tRNA formyltransferase [Armatimonadota bacterium]
MRVVFAGTSEFAVPSLEVLIASAHEVVAVVTQPDKPKGRGGEIQMPPIKEIALAHSLPVLQPENVAEPKSIAEIKALGPIGAMVVVAYGQKIPTEILQWPKYGCVNVHGSILPKYRGAAPIQHAIIAGEKTTGVTTMLMDEGWDTGDILLQESIEILPNETAGELSQRLSFLGARLLIRTLDGLEMGTINPIPQDEELATLAPSLKRDSGAIDWSAPADVIVNLVRGCTPKPGAFTRFGNSMVKIWRATVDRANGIQGEPGEVIRVDQDGIVVAAGHGSVRLLDVQPESRKRVLAAEFAHGARLKPGDRLEVRFNMP